MIDYYKVPDGFYLEDNVLKEKPEHKEERLEKQAKALYKHYGFDMRNYDFNPRKYVGAKSVESKNRLINYVKQFKENPEVQKLVVYMYGPNGCQKSTMASWVGKSLIRDKYSVRYILMDSLIKLLERAERDTEARSDVDLLMKSDLLVIDEAFDKSKVKLFSTGWQNSFIDSFIRTRIQSENKGILFISNVKPEDIETQGFSHSIQDFVQRETENHKTLLTFEDNYLQNRQSEPIVLF